ncbi:hypothetical protein GGR58DRAFT_512830 [Xylaria digitata]|nr:hypothetical protein GGR58DRAFT_512830 [Xylaria digitata]
MATTSSSAVARPVVGQALQHAINEFRSVLSDEQRCELDNLNPVPDADAILVFTARLDRIDPNRRGRSFSSRLHTILLAVRNFCSIVDTFVSSHPEIAALVWGSVKLTMLIISNYTSYYDALSDLFMRVGRLCPLFNEYLILYQSSTRLRQSLLDFHQSIIYCCKHVVETVKRPWQKQVLNAFWNSFEQEFKPDIDDIQRFSNHVKEEIALTQAQADSQEQKLQAMERENASLNRLNARKFFSRTDKSNTRKTRKRRQRLLDALSTYDHLRALKQSRLKRYKNTSDWIFQTPEFNRWVDGEVPLLCCFGKIDSWIRQNDCYVSIATAFRYGNKLLTSNSASVIDHILCERGSDCIVSFFFVESRNPESLSADTIIRSILRQRLDPTQIPQEVVEGLELLDDSSGLDEFVKLLRIIMPPPKASYIVIDGLDECERPDRDRLLKALSSLVVVGKNIRLFLSSRTGLWGEIQGRLTAFDSLSMDCPLAHDDIRTFIEEIVKEKIQNNELRIGDPCLEGDIKLALSRGAQGMFLWVTFQIYEICAQHCDEDIRHVLNHLPRSLTETYCRVLQRIVSRGHGKEAQKIFPWIAASKQLLSLSQLREAIAIEIGQQSSKPERLYNDIENAALWCENLIQVDEEDQLVQFAHSTVREFLVEGPLDSTLAEFHINVEEVDHYIGEICITYLDFNDFKTTVARRAKPFLLRDTTQMVQSALGYQSKPASMLAKLLPKSVSKPVDLSVLQSLTGKDSSTNYKKLVLGYPFLDYGSINWVLHTKDFRQEISKTWRLWENMIVYGHNLAKPLWGEDTFNANGSILDWAYNARHYALIRLVYNSNELHGDRRSQIIQRSITDEGQDSDWAIDYLLRDAAERGQLEFVKRLITAKANVNSISGHGIEMHETPASMEYFTRAAAEESRGWTALQAAAKNGHIEIVRILLASKADVNAAAANAFGRTALHAAAENGHVEIVRLLLASKANTVLQAAAGSGYIEIVKMLLAAKADVNATASEYRGRTALQAAAESGYIEIVEILLAAKADVNAAASEYRGRTALQAAAERGYIEIVKILLAAKADVNAAAAGKYGRTALQAAAGSGSIEIVKMLLAVKADASAAAAEEYGTTALRAAIQGSHRGIQASLAGYDDGTGLSSPSIAGEKIPNVNRQPRYTEARASIPAPPPAAGIKPSSELTK